MLSRTAEHLFWMTRHTARADHLARLLDACYQRSLLPAYAGASEAEDSAAHSWLTILSIVGLADHYRLSHHGIERREVIAYLGADAANPSSIVSSLRFARENARAVRGCLGAELWETLNATWLDLQRLLADDLHEHDPYAFFEWIKQRLHLVRGVQLAAPVQNETSAFLHLGGCVERADHMARTLEAHCELLKPDAFDYHGANALLRAVSGLDAYREVYRDAIAPARVAALLVQCQDWPGSLAASLEEIRRIAVRLRNGQSAQTERLALQLCEEVRQAPLDAWFANEQTSALRSWLVALIARINELARRVGRDLVRPAIPEPVAAAA
ncbi:MULTISPECIES: alpha-E domain-containing protein [unclassified Paraburkholderia]|uniref:alpha-E domain-containing protein n=1 Tax=unclassified Paraburkholderia TaxID=2615204 RepID=UPI002AB19D0D|nr:MULTISPECIES: alpha-E domain-containing protein [unclassified Paraburkholderia]